MRRSLGMIFKDRHARHQRYFLRVFLSFDVHVSAICLLLPEPLLSNKRGDMTETSYKDRIHVTDPGFQPT